jgi:hypothetical protein
MGQRSTLYKTTNCKTSLAAILAFFCFQVLVAQVQVTVSSTNVTCFGLSNGTATATGSGGWAPYVYEWSTGATTQTVTGLAAGTYTVKATDIDLGFAITTVVITQPPQLGVQVYGESQICGIVPDGKATAVPFGGTPPYTYLWSNGGTSAQITGLAQGTYTVTVTDSKGCTAAGSSIVYFWDEGIWVMGMGTNVTCFGFNNGTATVSAMSGTPPYVYQWSTGAATQSVSGLSPGNYTVTVTDANGCSNLTVVAVTQPADITLTSSSTNAACGMAGSITVTASGGTPPYMITWNTGATGFTLTGMPGTYTATVKDANNCSKTITATIGGSNTGLSVNATVVSNAGCTVGGSATASVTGGGSGNYAFSWSNGQMTATATNLTAGNHSFTVTDITTGCTGTGTVNIPSAPPLLAAAALVTNATCTVGGSATASASGGTPPYTFKWDNNQMTATATNLSAGPHSVTVTDSKGCVATANITIGQTQGPTVTATVVTNATCTSGGSATATATGGAGGYVFLWSNGQTTATATNLAPGTRTVTVTDAAGCSATATVNIGQTGTPTAIVSVGSVATCLTGGSATAGANGGTAPYTFKWSNGVMTATANNLTPGTYTVTVTDAAGCTATNQISVAAALPPNVVIVASANAKCDQLGSATASASGGAGSYTYQWSNGATTATAALPAGVFTVTVRDAAGCTSTATVNIGSTNNGIKIGDYVWYDYSQDGFQNNNETAGVPGVSVMLIKPGTDGIFGTADDVTVGTTTTNASGLYEFTCVTPGTYILMFSGIPAGYTYSPKDNVPSNDCKDSDVNPNGKTAPFTIVAGQTDNLCFDAGIHIPCDNVDDAGGVCCNQSICEGQTPALIYETAPPFGGTGALEYQWLQLVEVFGNPVWQPIPGALGKTYQPGPLFETARYMRCARREGCNNYLESNIVTITVLPPGSPGCPSFTTALVASLTNNNQVLLGWTTPAEGAEYRYTVQHSLNDITWENIASVMGHQDATAPNNYEAIHETPVNGANYYRVKRQNANNVEVISESVKINLDLSEASAISINPNPVTTNLTIKNLMEYPYDVKIAITATNGDVLQTINIPAGTLLNEDFPMVDLPSGLYLVRIHLGNDTVKTLKITKI